jgi:CheY-like chemotaxis protein
VVDDDATIGKVLRRMLDEDHDVTVVTTASEALDRLVAGQEFDAILCDLMMPEMTGMDLYAEISFRLPRVKDRMVFMTGGAFTSRARSFLDEVPNARIEKPFVIQNVRALLAAMVR